MVSTIDDDAVELSEYFAVMISSVDKPEVVEIGSSDTSFITIEDNEQGNMQCCDLALLHTYILDLKLYMFSHMLTVNSTPHPFWQGVSALIDTPGDQCPPVWTTKLQHCQSCYYRNWWNIMRIESFANVSAQLYAALSHEHIYTYSASRSSICTSWCNEKDHQHYIVAGQSWHWHGPECSNNMQLLQGHDCEPCHVLAHVVAAFQWTCFESSFLFLKVHFSLKPLPL